MPTRFRGGRSPTAPPGVGRLSADDPEGPEPILGYDPEEEELLARCDMRVLRRRLRGVRAAEVPHDKIVQAFQQLSQERIADPAPIPSNKLSGTLTTYGDVTEAAIQMDHFVTDIREMDGKFEWYLQRNRDKKHLATQVAGKAALDQHTRNIVSVLSVGAVAAETIYANPPSLKDVQKYSEARDIVRTKAAMAEFDAARKEARTQIEHTIPNNKLLKAQAETIYQASYALHETSSRKREKAARNGNRLELLTGVTGAASNVLAGFAPAQALSKGVRSASERSDKLTALSWFDRDMLRDMMDHGCSPHYALQACIFADHLVKAAGHSWIMICGVDYFWDNSSNLLRSIEDDFEAMDKEFRDTPDFAQLHESAKLTDKSCEELEARMKQYRGRVEEILKGMKVTIRARDD